jgi:hypothetical protein
MRRQLFIVGLTVLAFLLSSCGNAGYDPKLSDKELFLQYYQGYMLRLKEFDDLYTPLANASKRSLVSAVVVAKNIDYELGQRWLRIEEIKAPPLANQAARKRLDTARSLMCSVAYHQVMVKDALLKYAKDPSLDNLATMRSHSDDAQINMRLGAGELMAVIDLLGITKAELATKKVSLSPSK